jgi:hypothetical protein
MAGAVSRRGDSLSVLSLAALSFSWVLALLSGLASRHGYRPALIPWIGNIAKAIRAPSARMESHSLETGPPRCWLSRLPGLLSAAPVAARPGSHISAVRIAGGDSRIQYMLAAPPSLREGEPNSQRRGLRMGLSGRVPKLWEAAGFMLC